jgi:glycosyltransferase involved in cell wall biosynthesis
MTPNAPGKSGMSSIVNSAQSGEANVTRTCPHISVCVCTYKRPHLLKKTVEGICSQQTNGQFTFSVVVADNDKAESARSTAAEVATHSTVAIHYCVEPVQNIASARNRAVQNAAGAFVAFIDDDEFPVQDWLLNLYRTFGANEVAGVLGPVNPHFEAGTPRWVVEGGFYDRPGHPTGTVLTWRKCRTGNVLLTRDVLTATGQPFNPACLSGEDQDFFRRRIESGHRFIWCQEAPVFEVVPPSRWKRSFLIRRALFRGVFAQRNHGFQAVRVLQAIISVPAYLLFLPAAFLMGQARFMSCVFKLSYHTGRLLALCGLNPIRQAYVVE